MPRPLEPGSRNERMMKLLIRLFSLLWHTNSPSAHDDNLRAGKEAGDRQTQPSHWNSLLL